MEVAIFVLMLGDNSMNTHSPVIIELLLAYCVYSKLCGAELHVVETAYSSV